MHISHEMKSHTEKSHKSTSVACSAASNVAPLTESKKLLAGSGCTKRTAERNAAVEFVLALSQT